MNYEDKIKEETDQVMQAGEQIATTVNASPSVRSKKSNAEEYAQKICFTQEEINELKAHNFYRNEAPKNDEPATIEEQVEFLDSIDGEGYVSQAEVEHLKTLWKHVG